MECMCAQTRPQFILSSERVLRNGVRTQFNSKGKIPSIRGPQEGLTRDAASSRTASPTHYRPSYSSPDQGIKLHFPWLCHTSDLKKKGLQWLPCQAPGSTWSVWGLIGPVSVYCDWMRWQVWFALSISVWQHVQLSEQIYVVDTLAYCWDVKQPNNQHRDLLHTV